MTVHMAVHMAVRVTVRMAVRMAVSMAVRMAVRVVCSESTPRHGTHALGVRVCWSFGKQVLPALFPSGSTVWHGAHHMSIWHGAHHMAYRSPYGIPLTIWHGAHHMAYRSPYGIPLTIWHGAHHMAYRSPYGILLTIWHGTCSRIGLNTDTVFIITSNANDCIYRSVYMRTLHY